MEAETMIRLAKNFCNVSFYDKDESKSHDAVVIDEGLQPWDFYATVADNDQGVWKALRLYRLWLTAVLRHGNADQHIPDTISRRRLANFWILLGLFYCKRKVEGGLHAQGTELLTTLECYQHTSGNADNTKTFIDMLSSVTSEVKGAQLLDVGDKVMHKFSPSKHIIFTPEIDDVHFRRIVERDVGMVTVRAMMSKLAYGKSVYRTPKPIVIKMTAMSAPLDFLRHTPPRCTYCLLKQAAMCARYIPDASMLCRRRATFIVDDIIWRSATQNTSST